MRLLLTILCALALLPMSGAAQNAPTLKHLDDAADPGEPITESDRQFINQVLDALRRKDNVWIANNTYYPVMVDSTFGHRRVKTSKKFTAVLKRKLTDKVRATILNAANQPIFKNWQGLMLGNGELWITELGDDTSSYKYYIVAIGNFAFQPEDAWIPTSKAP